MTALETMKEFELDSLPDLDTAVLAALELLTDADLPPSTTPFRRPLVIGSGNAEATGRILFAANDAVFADESSYLHKLDSIHEIDGAVVISASGSKHSVQIAKDLKDREVNTLLFTNTEDSPAGQFLDSDNIRVFPKNREPYTYNTSTYLSMIMADTGEDASIIREFLDREVEPLANLDFGSYRAFTFILPGEFAELRPMLRTKFDELFGPKMPGRIFTEEEIKHAKTVVNDEKELFISFGIVNDLYGLEDNRLNIPLPQDGGYGAALAVTYYLVGLIQKAHPPYFKEKVASYCQQASDIFGQDISPIVS